MADNVLFTIGMLLVLAGFGVAILAFIVVILKSARGTGQARGGGVVMIGPVPIIFGTDRESTKTLVLLAIALMLFFLVLTLLPILWR